MLRMPSGITFATDQSAIQPQFRPVLDDVAKVLKDYPSTYIDVYGHTDSTGSDVYNQSLSERRAQAVADYLSVNGVQSARVATRGFGETQPIASNTTEEGKAQRSEEHTSELQSLMRNSYAVFCLKKKNQREQPKT